MVLVQAEFGPDAVGWMVLGPSGDYKEVDTWASRYHTLAAEASPAAAAVRV